MPNILRDTLLKKIGLNIRLKKGNFTRNTANYDLSTKQYKNLLLLTNVYTLYI